MDDYCVSSEEFCVGICSKREKCYGYAFALKPSIESMNNGKNAKNCGMGFPEQSRKGRCVIYLRDSSDSMKINKTTSDRIEYACSCKLALHTLECIGAEPRNRDEPSGLLDWFDGIWDGWTGAILVTCIVVTSVCIRELCCPWCRWDGGGGGGGCGGGGCGGGGCGGGGCGG